MLTKTIWIHLFSSRNKYRSPAYLSLAVVVLITLPVPNISHLTLLPQQKTFLDGFSTNLAMVRLFPIPFLRRVICSSPRKCFIFLLISTVCLVMVLLWNQNNLEPVPFTPRRRVSHDSGMNVSFPYLNLNDFQWSLEPERSVCGVGEMDEEAEDKLRSRLRWNELLEARPDNEEPEPPPPEKSYGIAFVIDGCEEVVKRTTIRRTWGSGAWIKGRRLRVVFVCSAGQGSDVGKEAEIFGDVLLTASPTKSPLISALSWLHRTCLDTFPVFIIKLDSSTFLNLDSVILWSESLEPGIYGNIRSTGPDLLHSLVAHHKDSLMISQHTEYISGEFFLVKSPSYIKNLISFIPKVPFVPEENYFLTGILADYAEIARLPAQRLKSGWDHITGCSVTHENAFTHLSANIMDILWSTITKNKDFLCRKGDGCCENSLPDMIASLVIWTMVLGLSWSIIHSYFWSQTALFCTDICSTVDLDSDDYDDSPEPSTALYDSDNEVVPESLYGFNNTRTYANQERY